MSSTHLSPSLNFYKQACSNNNAWQCIGQSRQSVGVWEVGILFPLHSALLPGLLLQHTLHTSVCFVGCERSDPSVLAAEKWRSYTEMLVFIGSTSMCPLTTPTKSHPHKFNYCKLFFAMPSALAKFTKVKFMQNIIALGVYRKSFTYRFQSQMHAANVIFSCGQLRSCRHIAQSNGSSMWEKKACLRAGCATGRGEWWKLKRNEGYKWSENGEGADNWEGHLESEWERQRHRLLGESAREREGRLQSRAQTANTSLID